MLTSRISSKSILFLLLLLPTAIFAGDSEWRPVTPEEVGLKEAKVEKDADAEALFWEVRIDDSGEDTIYTHYLRIKIFSERGRDKFSKVDIPFFKGEEKIRELAARVISADGSAYELKKEDFFERDLVKADGVKYKAMSFAVPKIEPGVILEYRYKQIKKFGLANNMRLVFQDDFPIQRKTYYLRPLEGYNVKYLVFNMRGQEMVKDKNGYSRIQMINMPSLKEEPRMPPNDEVQSWLLFYLSLDENTDPGKFWSNVGYYLAQDFDIKDTLKPGSDLKRAAAEIIGNASTDEEKLRKLFDFCRTRIKNISFDPAITDEEKEKIKPNKSTSETYKKLQGRGLEINDLFASLAIAAGFEARITFTGDRSKIFFSRQHAHSSFVHPSSVAVRAGGRGWQFFDPGMPFIPYGMLVWWEEHQTAFLLGGKDYITSETPMSPFESSKEKRTGKFKLLEDGTLEGDVRVEYSGQLGYLRKSNNYDETAAKREELLKEEIKTRLSTAEISDISVENISDAEKPFVYNFKVRVPDYAQKTGKRLIIQPGFFEYGGSPQFTSASRKYDVYFHFPWSEEDSVDIELPKGFILDSPDTPADIADTNGISSLTVRMQIANDTNVLKYQRKFSFGGGGNIMFKKEAYPAIKQLFDQFNKSDTHAITIRQK